MSSYKLYEYRKYRQELAEVLLEDYNLKIKEIEEEEDGGDSSLSPRRSLQSPAILQILKATFDFSECSAHHTSRFGITKGDNPKAVFRRGQPFNINFSINRPYKPEEDLLNIIFEYGPEPSFNNGTKYSIPVLSSNNTTKQWSAQLIEHKEKSVTVKVHCPADSQIGRWIFKIFVHSKISKENKLLSSAENVLFILFNPWCEDDEVFLEDEKKREGYVLNEHGVIARGDKRNPISKTWIYGQYDISVLFALILLLDRSDLPYHQRGSAALISRALSSLMSSTDNNGLIVGSWAKSYDDGTSPESWTGSIAIYEKYLTSKGTPVKYAQCWVFSGCLTTACRALGIPCRSVTCYRSAHDTDKTLSVEVYINEYNKVDSTMGADYIWNYHCWNEVWFSRRDLPKEFSGWQAIDGTPQERSQGTYRLGPSSVHAVKEGLIGLNFDVMFVFSEVSAHVKRYYKNEKGSYYLNSIQIDGTGNLILTEKLPSNNGHEDITDTYKYPPDSEKGRDVFNRALSNTENPSPYKYYKLNEKPRDVVFTLEKITNVQYGESFCVNLHIENKSDEKRVVETNLLVTVVLYTQTLVATIKDEDAQVELNPREKKTARLVIEKEDYENAVGKSSNIKIVANCNVVETKQKYATTEVFEMGMKQLKIDIPQYIPMDAEFEAIFSFTNPLPVELTSCRLVVEGPGVMRPVSYTIPNVPVNGEMRKSFVMKGRRVGPCMFTAVFTSNELSHVLGNGTVTVKA